MQLLVHNDSHFKLVYFFLSFMGLVDGVSSFVSSYPLNDAAETVNEIGASVRRVMGGTSGILYFSFFVY